MSRTMLIWQSVMAGLQVLAGLATLGDLIGKTPAGIVVIGVAVLQAATATYTRGLVTPVPSSEETKS